jgi:hypothetical protein
MSRCIALLILGWLTQGCATLQIRVDSFQGELPESLVRAQAQAKALLGEPIFRDDAWRHNRYDQLEKSVGDALYNANLKVHEKNEEPKAKELAGKERDAVLRDFAEAWKKVTEAADQLAVAARTLVLGGNPEGGTPTPMVAFAKAIQAYELQVSSLASETAWYRGDQPEVRAAVRAELEAARTELLVGVRAIAASTPIDGRVVGVPIFDDRIAKLVGRDEKRGKDKPWVEFGCLRFRANGGSAQFVVVREGLLVFNQKSLDFDPTPVIDSGEALAKTGLRLAAALASGKAPGPGGTAEVQAAPQTLVNEADLEANREALATRAAAKRELLVGLASLLEAAKALEEIGLTDDGLKRLWSELTSQLAHFKGRTATQEGGL